MAKNRVEPWKMTHTLETDFFLGGPNGKVVAPDIPVICPVDKKRDSKMKNRLLAPNIQILGQLHIFIPSNQLELDQSIFQHKSGVSLVP